MEIAQYIALDEQFCFKLLNGSISNTTFVYLHSLPANALSNFK